MFFEKYTLGGTNWFLFGFKEAPKLEGMTACVINSGQIALLGGYSDQLLSQVVLFDTKRQRFKTVLESSSEFFGFQSKGAASVAYLAENDNVVTLVSD